MARSPADTTTPLVLQTGQQLFAAGEPGTAAYFVESGRVELLTAQDVRVALIEAGDFLGEAQALVGGPRSFTARALAETRLLPVEGRALQALIGAHPEVALAMLRRLAPRLEVALSALVPYATATATAPATAARLEHAESGSEFVLPDADDVLVGRSDPRSQARPDLDLAGIDPTRSLSRKHARITRQAGLYELREEARVANGTFRNGQRLAAGERVALQSGDELRFGTVALTFRVG